MLEPVLVRYDVTSILVTGTVASVVALKGEIVRRKGEVDVLMKWSKGTNRNNLLIGIYLTGETD